MSIPPGIPSPGMANNWNGITASIQARQERAPSQNRDLAWAQPTGNIMRKSPLNASDFEFLPFHKLAKDD
jgi:hypothetical protein